MHSPRTPHVVVGAVSDSASGNEIGMHRVAFRVDDLEWALRIAATHGCYPVHDVAHITQPGGPDHLSRQIVETIRQVAQ